MKKLTQDIFKGMPNSVKSAVVDANGCLWVSSIYPVNHLRPGYQYWFVITGDKEGLKMIGKGYWDYIADWQNSAIDRI